MAMCFRLCIYLFVISLFILEPAYAAKPTRKSREELQLMEKRRLEMLVNNLGAGNYGPVENAMREFEEMGEEAVPHLTAVLRDKDQEKKVHLNAIYALGRLGKDGRRGVSAIITYLRRNDEDFKAVSAIALGKIGKSARDAVVPLSQLLFDESPWVIKSARDALLKIGTEQAQKSVADWDELQNKIEIRR